MVLAIISEPTCLCVGIINKQEHSAGQWVLSQSVLDDKAYMLDR